MKSGGIFLEGTTHTFTHQSQEIYACVATWRCAGIVKDVWGGKTDKAMAITRTSKGGIDFSTDKMHVQIKADGNDAGIKFHLDPAMLRQLQNAPGFVPVIINIQPLKNISVFLGLNN